MVDIASLMNTLQGTFFDQSPLMLDAGVDNNVSFHISDLRVIFIKAWTFSIKAVTIYLGFTKSELLPNKWTEVNICEDICTNFK